MKKVGFAFGVCILISSWSAGAAGATTPLQGTKDLIAAITAPAGTQAKAMSKVRDYFDYDYLIRIPIEPHKDRLTTDQLARYNKMFRELLENAPLIASIGDGKQLEYTIGKPTEQNGEVKVGLQAYNSETDMDTDVAFTWRRQKDAWQIIDVTIDGASMLKGYQNQFGSVLRKEGPEGFLTRLEKKLNEVRAQQKSGS
jgi:phospholipid transport system substrate-binding protein